MGVSRGYILGVGEGGYTNAVMDFPCMCGVSGVGCSMDVENSEEEGRSTRNRDEIERGVLPAILSTCTCPNELRNKENSRVSSTKTSRETVPRKGDRLICARSRSEASEFHIFR